MMEQKNRMVFTIAVILLIFTAVFVSFGRILFRMDTPDVTLPSVSVSQPGEGTGNDGSSASGQTVSVTPATVQNVIATLERSGSYYRELTVEQFWMSGASATTVQTWVDGGWCHSYQQLPNGAGRHDILGADTLYYWYDGSVEFESAPAGDHSADLAQRIPTYETVLALDPNTITAAGYELKHDLPCVYVEAAEEETDSVRSYWVSVDNGLLICAELRRSDEVIYRMTSSAVQSPCPTAAAFRLPDGTVLHNP